METGALGITPSAQDDLVALKRVCRGRISIIGNLNALAMRRWTDGEIDRRVREAITAGAPGGGFILSDNHGEIPFQVNDATLRKVSAAARRWGQYPIQNGYDDE